eukprot:CAMPEP_0181199964 /NCGR_PEP_ID=MMETSP1096-20121128/17483_1 /TAXON_ID=156174 ORGANISM="Chrysochromulina ericina, Strain CCMP281" /NCGR_SAMPLE_ID=MMETSP1096 /ASSEMBLY_ACC=CAM_ASM_000453 /LENGTH=128 /DNA_ID=CAMNT_0023290233 /DNA_START=508 /DNA_END=891 /DNA_ORIENTATION=+
MCGGRCSVKMQCEDARSAKTNVGPDATTIVVSYAFDAMPVPTKCCKHLLDMLSGWPHTLGVMGPMLHGGHMPKRLWSDNHAKVKKAAVSLENGLRCSATHVSCKCAAGGSRELSSTPSNRDPASSLPR